MTITVSTTDRRDGKALALFARCSEWQTGHTKDGRPFFGIPGSEPGLFHMTDQNDCSCPDRQRERNVCKHMRAVRLWMAAFATGAVALRPRPATPGVADDAGIGDELISLTPEGAAYLAGVDDQPMSERTTPAPGAERIFVARLIAEQDAHRRALLTSGVRPVDDPVWNERADHIRRLQAKLPPVTFGAVAR